MFKKRLDLTGQKFSRLAVIAIARVDPRGNTCWLCRCDCGNETVVRGSDLRSGGTVSCGCLKTELSTTRLAVLALRHGHRRNGSYSPEYKCWKGMNQRCSNPKNTAWKNYGGRGIRVCDRWLHSFENFLADMGRKLSPAHTIERNDNDGNYEPGNCRWATQLEQVHNQRPRRRAA